MTKLMSDLPTLSLQDVMTTLAKCIDAGNLDNDSILRFVSELTGVSEDGICQALDEGQLLAPFYEQKMQKQLSRERLIDIIHNYVSNDAEATELTYVQEALSQAGCDKQDAKELGLEWIWTED